MKNSVLAFVCVLTASMATAGAIHSEKIVTHEGAVKITWQDPDSFRDVKASGPDQSRFKKQTFDVLTRSLAKEAQTVLKPGQTLSLVVTDLDLAGDVRPSFGKAISDIRLVKEIYTPKISFRYKVSDEGRTVLSGEERLSDISFMRKIRGRKDKPYAYESRLLVDWMRNTVKPQL